MLNIYYNLDPIIGATLVSVIGYLYGPSVWEGLDFIAKTIDYSPYSIIPTETSVSPEINQFPDVVTEIEQQNIPQEEKNTIVYENISNEPISSVTTTSIDINEKSREIIDWESAASQFSGVEFRPLSLVMRLFAAVSTLGSGCSLGIVVKKILTNRKYVMITLYYFKCRSRRTISRNWGGLE
jgi:hypothetical protein